MLHFLDLCLTFLVIFPDMPAGTAVPDVLLTCTGTLALAWSFPDWIWRG